MCKSAVQVVILAYAKKQFSASCQVIYLSISALLQGLHVHASFSQELFSLFPTTND